MKTSLLGRIVRVADNLFRDPQSGRYYGVKKVAGKRKLHSFDTSDRTTANGKLANWLRDLDAADASAVDLKFEALLENFLATRRGKSKATQVTECGIAATLRKGFVRGMAVPVRSIRPSDLIKWLVAENEARGWGFEYYNRCRFFLRQLFDLAVSDRVVSAEMNPFQPEVIKKRRRQVKTGRNIPTLDQFDKIIASVRAQKDYAKCEESADFLAFQGLLGVGQAEAWSLKRSDILSGDKINFVRQKTGRPFTVPVYDWAKELVQKLRDKPANIDGKLFHIRDGKKALGAACRRLGLPHFTQRNLRAMCIKRLYDAGVSPKQIGKWQGHSDGGVLVQNTYTEVFCDNDVAAEEANLALVRRANLAKLAA